MAGEGVGLDDVGLGDASGETRGSEGVADASGSEGVADASGSEGVADACGAGPGPHATRTAIAHTETTARQLERV
jgi:hypothetical protein